MRRSTVLQNEDQPRRLSPLRIWTLCALPWLALVAGLSVYDHQPAIGVMAQADAPESIATTVRTRCGHTLSAGSSESNTIVASGSAMMPASTAANTVQPGDTRSPCRQRAKFAASPEAFLPFCATSVIGALAS